jgi:hypothetical protein
MTEKKKVSQLTRALQEIADDMRDADLIDQEAHQKITARLTGDAFASTSQQLTPIEPSS